MTRWESVQWEALGRGVLTTRPDPYLIWAILTGWKDFEALSQNHPVPLLLELRAERIDDFRAALAADSRAAPAPFYFNVPKVYGSGRHLTLWIEPSGLATLSDPSSKSGPMIERLELCHYAKQMRLRKNPRQDGPRLQRNEKRKKGRPELTGKVLIGVVDTGCPLAHEQLRSTTTRIAALWDLRHRQAAAFGRLRRIGVVPGSMGYGWQVCRSGEKGLARWLEQFQQSDGSFDDTSAYLAAGYAELRRRGTHGAHVLSLLAGPVSLGGRISLDPSEPPSWQGVPGDAASDARKSDIVFVQLPSLALQDGSGGWLGAHVLDAVSYIVDCAEANPNIEHVVVNISYGTTVGPHDGTSILEVALDRLIARGGTMSKPSVDICTAAGNSFDRRTHASLEPRHYHVDAGRKRSSPLVWRVPPGSESPAFLQVWLPKHHKADNLTINVVPPDGDAAELAVDTTMQWKSPKGDPMATALFFGPGKHSRGDGSALLLLTVGPTETLEQREPALHGDWKVWLQMNRASDPPPSQVDAYIARNDRDMGTMLRGRPSYFVDEADEPTRYLVGHRDDPDMDDRDIDTHGARTGAVLRRRGTLNGIATATRVRAAAGYQLQSGEHAPYSSAGRVGTGRGRVPDAAFVTDQATVLRGVPAGGASSGAVVRLVGTSAAAPQDARRVVNERFDNGQLTPVVGPQPDNPKDAIDLLGPEGLRPPV